LGLTLKKKRHEKSGKEKTTLPDPRFNDQLVTRFVNNLMWDGKNRQRLKYFMMQLTSLSLRNKMLKTIIRNWKDA
jgi:ribosomal protein S7